MRIIAGRYKGKRLLSPKGEDVRPTTSRIKETLFNVLQRDVPDACGQRLAWYRMHFARSGARDFFGQEQGQCRAYPRKP